MAQDNLGRNLRMLRAERGLTLVEAEKLTGITRETLSELEHGTRDAYPATLRKLAHAYNMTPGELLEGEIGLLTAGKGEAPATPAGHALLEKALNAARQDAEKTAQAINRLNASEGTLRATNITQFEEDALRAELRALGFPDEHFFENLLWPLAERVVELEGEISRLRGRLEAQESSASGAEAEETSESEAERVTNG